MNECVLKVEDAKSCKVMSRGYAVLCGTDCSRAWRSATGGLKSRLWQMPKERSPGTSELRLKHAGAEGVCGEEFVWDASKEMTEAWRLKAVGFPGGREQRKANSALRSRYVEQAANQKYTVTCYISQSRA